MKKMTNIILLGDSILKGVQINPINSKYYVNNTMIDEKLNEKYSLLIENYSSFGCTVTKGNSLLTKRLDKSMDCDAVIMDFGGNDCDYNWRAIAENPKGKHLPNTPIELFRTIYCEMIDHLRSKNILPIITTLTPLEPQRFFDWFCGDLDKKNILSWLGEINNIYHHQEKYSKAVEEIALEKNVPLIDLRGAFLKAGTAKDLLCMDGTHPNTLGQRIIAQTLYRSADTNRPFHFQAASLPH